MTRRAYAAGTRVSVSRSERELKDLLRKEGAVNIATAEPIGWAVVQFDLHDRRIRLRMPVPFWTEERLTRDKRGFTRTEAAARKLCAQACQEQWRALVLALRSRFVNIHSGIESFETAFLPYILMPDGKTVGEHALPAVESAYRRGVMPDHPMLGPGAAS